MRGKHSHSYKNLAIYATLISTSGADKTSTDDAGPQTYKMLHFLGGFLRNRFRSADRR